MSQLVCSLILGFGIHVSNPLRDHPRPIHSALISLYLPTVVCIVAIWSLPATEIRSMNMGKRARVTRRRRGFRQRIKTRFRHFVERLKLKKLSSSPETAAPEIASPDIASLKRISQEAALGAPAPEAAAPASEVAGPTSEAAGPASEITAPASKADEDCVPRAESLPGRGLWDRATESLEAQEQKKLQDIIKSQSKAQGVTSTLDVVQLVASEAQKLKPRDDDPKWKSVSPANNDQLHR